MAVAGISAFAVGALAVLLAQSVRASYEIHRSQQDLIVRASESDRVAARLDECAEYFKSIESEDHEQALKQVHALQRAVARIVRDGIKQGVIPPEFAQLRLSADLLWVWRAIVDELQEKSPQLPRWQDMVPPNGDWKTWRSHGAATATALKGYVLDLSKS